MKPLLSAVLCFGAAVLLEAAPPPEAIRLRNQGIAELENEAPAKAEASFKALVALVPQDPLGHANLAIARLRQQKLGEAMAAIEAALKREPDDPELLAIQAEIHHWSGENERALELFRRAAAARPDDAVTQYSLYRQATTMSGPGVDEATREALDRLQRLRPENLVVLLQLGQRARVEGDRSGATASYLRIRELIWQAPPGADRLLDQIFGALEADDLDDLRAPALRLENVLKITPMYREGLRELTSGIQGDPVVAFRDEPPVTSWGGAARVRFLARRLSADGNAAAGLAVADLDGDETPEIARLVGGDTVALEILDGTDAVTEPTRLPASTAQRLLAADIDNDGVQDLLAFGPQGAAAWRGTTDGLIAATADFGLDEARATAAAVFDFDVEGDLDLLLAGARTRLYRNALRGPLEDVADRSLPRLDVPPIDDALASDLDRDGDIDLLLAHRRGLVWLDNLRQGRFSDRSTEMPAAGSPRRIASADLDNDGLPDLVTVGESVRFFRNEGGRLVPWKPAGTVARADLVALTIFDVDNDGRLDLALGGAAGVTILAQRDERFELLPPVAGLGAVTALVAFDHDGDGDLDLLADGPTGLFLLENHGGNANRYLAVRLRGLTTGNSKNNVFGIGAKVEVQAGAAYQFREVTGEVTHLGLGAVAEPDLVRVVWTNGVPQNRLAPAANQRIVEEQLLKGSCPFLYARTADGFRFVTDLLWGAPVGLPVRDGVYLAADPQELVAIGPLAAIDDRYEIRITEELWEAAFFDYLRLWVVDHPQTVEVASSLRVQPGETVPERVHGSLDVRPVAAAWDAAGRDVTERVRRRDDVYADGWTRSAYQGVAAEPWVFTFDLGEAPAAPVRLHLDGWIFPTDASLNIALAQRPEPVPLPPRLQVETGSGWTTLLPAMGFPAGKTKTMIVDTPSLPTGARRLRIASGQWLSWDRVAWTKRPADGEPRVVAKLAAHEAELRYRGFSALLRRAPNAPHEFDYDSVRDSSPWLPFPGRYTRYGDVRELLAEADDRSVILGPGDEMAITFDAAALPPPAPGYRRTLFLESHGWDKDADRNTGEGLQVEPLPFRAMSGYPYGADESFPDTPLHREYVTTWLTRVVTVWQGGGLGRTPTAP